MLREMAFLLWLDDLPGEWVFCSYTLHLLIYGTPDNNNNVL